MTMDILETQVSDLRYLTNTPPVRGQAPGAVSETNPGGPAPSPRHPVASPLSAPGDNSARSHAPFSPAFGSSTGGTGSRHNTASYGSNNAAGATKRKASSVVAVGDDDPEESGGRQVRSKRNRYISIACNECKRRKIKCNGETPCQRCGNLNLTCLYTPNCCSSNVKDSAEFKEMSDKLAQLQEQVDALYQDMTALREDHALRLAPIGDSSNRILPPPTPNPTFPGSNPNSTSSPAPSSSTVNSIHRHDMSTSRGPQLQYPPPPPSSSFRGPTSHAFTVDVAKDTLHKLGYNEGHDHEHTQNFRVEGAGGTGIYGTTRGDDVRRPQQPFDPLWDFDKDEMIRLCRVHEEEIGIMYPVTKIEEVIDHAVAVAGWMDSVRRQGPGGSRLGGTVPPFSNEDSGGSLDDIKTLQLKVIMAIGLVVEEHGNSVKAARLFENIRPSADKMLMSDPTDITTIPFLALVGGYRFLSNEEVLAWRVMGQVARHCLELGLHRREGIVKIPEGQQRKNAINTFWTAYILDKRWSFGTGLPYVMHEDKIDPKLPYPEDLPYLDAMIDYSKLGARIWRIVDFFEPALMRDINHAEFESMDSEVLAWYDSIPDDIKIRNFGRDLPLPSTPSYNLQRLQIWTRLRLNQMRIWLHTPVLHSASCIQDNLHLAHKAVDCARETINYLARLNNSSNLYRRLQVFYHQFLTSAIAVLFLASTHAPLVFSERCHAEFYLALDLIRDMSAKSWVSQRLWRTVKSLKAYAPRLGLREQQQPVAASPAQMENMPPYYGPGMPGFGVGTLVVRDGTNGQHPSATPEGGSGKGTPTDGVAVSEDPQNGAKLRGEMSKIFEGYTSGGLSIVAAGRVANQGIENPNARPQGPGDATQERKEGDGVYEQMRILF